MLDSVLDALFPPRCGGCGTRGSWFCPSCCATVRAVPLKACRRCRRPVSLDPCPMCEYGGGPDSMLALARLEGPLRHGVHRLKYGDRPQLAGPLVAATLRRGRVGAGVIVPVPLHPERLRHRGYNQAGLLAGAVARGMGQRVVAALARQGPPGRQVGRGGEARRLALDGAFRWVATEVPPAAVILDDVLTTGTTLLECALAAQAAGVRRVDTLALALG